MVYNTIIQVRALPGYVASGAEVDNVKIEQAKIVQHACVQEPSFNYQYHNEVR